MAHNRHFGSKYSHFGENGKGHNFRAYGNNPGKHIDWDPSRNNLQVFGGIIGANTVIEKGANYTLSDTERANIFISLKATGASKTFTLGLDEGQIAFVYNHGAETFTLKNVADDTGNEVATTKLVLVIGSQTAKKSTVIALN